MDKFRKQEFYPRGTDSLDEYLKNLKKQPSDWHYSTNRFSYIRNTLGHRANELDQINLDDYILTTGCSLTEGIGLAIENTYTAKLAELMGCDYYNLGIAGSGLDILNHNLITWFSTVQKKPKLVVIQIPEPARFMTFDSIMAVTHVPGGVGESEHHRFMASGEIINFWKSRYLLYKNLWKNVIDVPIIEINASSERISPTELNFQKIDLARDLSHFGIESHSEMAKKIFEHTRSTL